MKNTKFDLRNLKNMKWNYLLLAFLGPFIGIVGVMIISGYTPFGKSSMLYSDCYHQYYPFFKTFRENILAGNGLLYSWDVGLGMDYLGLISYYLASPLNLLSILVPEKMLLAYFSFLVPIKLGLASLFFAYMLKKLFHRCDWSISLFGSMYGLCAWALGFQWNIMWVDTFALLPLVFLGTIQLLRDKKIVLYTLTLFLSVAANYYVGFFTCIFVLLSFICYQICFCRSFKAFFLDLCRIALFSILAIGMTAFLELPTLAALQTTQSSVNQFPTGFQLNITDDDTWKGLLDAMRQVAGNMGGGAALNFKEGLPNIYCGVGSIILAFTFLMLKGIKVREKICCVALLLFFNVSFIIRQLDYIWHGFHFTNMIPYRFSFLYSFVMLYMAYRAWMLRKHLRLWHVIAAAVLSCLIFLCSNDRSDMLYLVYNFGFLALYMIGAVYGVRREKITLAPLPETDDPMVLAIARKEQEEAKANHRAELKGRQDTACGLIAGILVVEMILNLVNFGLTFTGTLITNYPKGTDSADTIFRYIEEREDELFYRVEVNKTQALNDGALNGYNGISTFTSSANVKVTEFMKDLGYAAKNTYNRYCYEEASPVSELFLGLKYLVDRDGDKGSNPTYDELYRKNNVVLLEKNAYLPLGFLAESSLGQLDFSRSKDDFDFQNRLFESATGISGDVWTILPGDSLEIASDDVTIKSTNSGKCSYSAPDGGTLVYKFTAQEEGYLCLKLEMSKKNSFKIRRNDTEVISDNLSLPQIMGVDTVVPGDTIELRITCKDNETGTTNITAAVMNEDIFREGYEVLAASVLDLTNFKTTDLEGTIDCDRDGLLYTSIPQNGNWFAEVDGKEAEIVLVGDAMIALPMTAGSHTVRFYYRNSAFTIGLGITLVCAAVFALAVYVKHPPKKDKGKYQK